MCRKSGANFTNQSCFLKDLKNKETVVCSCCKFCKLHCLHVLVSAEIFLFFFKTLIRVLDCIFSQNILYFTGNLIFILQILQIYRIQTQKSVRCLFLF